MPLEETHLAIHPDFKIGTVDRRVFGSFVEHLGRCVYGGVFDPDSPNADAVGVREDVVSAAREMGVTCVRYPGGNFVSNYNWRDGVGPRSQRPIRKDLAWRTLESNAFGTDEFLRMCVSAGWVPMMTCNLGTGTPREALEWFQYINDAAGSTAMAKERASNGRGEPYGARLWCLGNEMDGPWQLGHRTPEDYATEAKVVAKMFKDDAPETETVVCGSSNLGMETFARWDATVLDVLGEHADHISLHAYLGNRDDDSEKYLFAADEIRRQISAIDAVCVSSAAKRRSKKRATLCFDEWNVWYRETSGSGNWSYAPPLLEEEYNLEDAIVVSDILHAFLERADVLKLANLAQLVNVIAPIMANDRGILKQTIFHPFKLFSRCAGGTSLSVAHRGPAPITSVKSPYVSASAVLMDEELRVLVTNRSLREAAPVSLTIHGMEFGEITGEILTGDDPKQANTWDSPNAIAPMNFSEFTREGTTMSTTLPPMSLASFVVKRSSQPAP